MLQPIIVSDLIPGMIIEVPDECYIKVTKITTPKGANNMRIITGRYSSDGTIFSDHVTSTIYRIMNEYVRIIINN